MTTSSIFIAHDVSDLFNALPTCLGFRPEDSICVIGTSGPQRRLGVSARVDLPDDPALLSAVVASLAVPLARSGADGVVVLVLSERVEDAEEAAWFLDGAIPGVDPVVTAWTDGERYWTTFDDQDPSGEPLHLSAHHPAVVNAVMAGQEILPDRATLERRWLPEESVRKDWLESQVGEVEQDLAREVAGGAPGDIAARGSAEVQETARSCVHGRPEDTALLRLCLWLTYGGVRDRLWASFERRQPDEVVSAWRDIARWAPTAYAAVPYAVAAYLAYLAGNGAQASIGVDEALRADPAYGMAHAFDGALRAGVHPDDVYQMVTGASRTALSAR